MELVAARLDVVVSPRTLTVLQNEMAEFRCETTGSPRARIEWTKEGGDLPETHSIFAGTLR